MFSAVSEDMESFIFFGSLFSSEGFSGVILAPLHTGCEGASKVNRSSFGASSYPLTHTDKSNNSEGIQKEG